MEANNTTVKQKRTYTRKPKVAEVNNIEIKPVEMPVQKQEIKPIETKQVEIPEIKPVEIPEIKPIETKSDFVEVV